MYEWIIPDCYTPEAEPGRAAAIISHEALCLLNDGKTDAQLEITLYFTDREPTGPFTYSLSARRSARIIMGRDYPLEGAQRLDAPGNTPYSAVIRSEALIGVQYSRVDTRLPGMALMTAVISPRKAF